MKVTVVCTHAEKSLYRGAQPKDAKPIKVLTRARFEAPDADAAPENKTVWPSTPALSLDVPNVNVPDGFEVGALYELEIRPKK